MSIFDAIKKAERQNAAPIFGAVKRQNGGIYRTPKRQNETGGFSGCWLQLWSPKSRFARQTGSVSIFQPLIDLSLFSQEGVIRDAEQNGPKCRHLISLAKQEVPEIFTPFYWWVLYAWNLVLGIVTTIPFKVILLHCCMHVNNTNIHINRWKSNLKHNSGFVQKNMLIKNLIKGINLPPV